MSQNLRSPFLFARSTADQIDWLRILGGWRCWQGKVSALQPIKSLYVNHLFVWHAFMRKFFDCQNKVSHKGHRGCLKSPFWILYCIQENRYEKFFLSSSFSENVTIYCCKAHYRVNEYSVSSIFFFKIRRKRPLFRLLGKKHSRIFSCFQVINKSFIKFPQLWCPFSFAFKRTIISTLCRQPDRSKAAKLS